MGEQPSGGKTVTCECGHPKVVYPPIPEYVNVYLEPCPQGDSIQRFFDCDNCTKRITYYWDRPHFYSGIILTVSQKRDDIDNPYFSTKYGRERSRGIGTDF